MHQQSFTSFLSLIGVIKRTSADRIALPLLQAPPDLSLVTMVTEAECPTMQCSSPAPIASLWLATALEKMRAEGNSCLMILNVGLFLPPAETLVCVSPGGDNGTQVVDGLPQSIRLHHQIQLVILLWLIWQVDTS